MLNFTEEIKNEITSSPVTSEGARAILSAFILTSGNIMLKNGFYGFELVTENERTAEFFLNILEENFGLSLNVRMKRRISF